MGQDWKTLSLVIIGAAIMGWWTMRSLSDDSDRRVASPPPELPTIPAPQRTAEPVAAPKQAEPAPPARIPGTSAPPAEPTDAASGDDESALILRDLESLSQDLVRDQRIEDRVMPRVNDVLDVPGVTKYRRSPDFWQPALAGQAEAKE